ncbi:hypothetical protein GCM10023063_20360 [Arthrobacter methylotrophus]|uniref:DUF4878 domain-containing protein n=1 Tax=Arthrobacter methylotrophus TaxID=121291 RepID=A0ABV5UXV6_9MICC
MNSMTKGFGVLVLTAAVALGASGCSQNAPAAAPSPTVDSSQLTGAKAAEAIKGFVAAGTSDAVAKAVAGKPTADTFSPAVKFIDKDANMATVQNTVSDFVLVKMADPKAPVSVTVDDSKVVVDGQKAMVPAAAVTVTAGGKKVSNCDVLAAEVNHLVFRDGAWVITFPAPASASPSATPSASAK